eukprot:14960342-Alexandrium_andersonii.AAC.1
MGPRGSGLDLGYHSLEIVASGDGRMLHFGGVPAIKPLGVGRGMPIGRLDHGGSDPGQHLLGASHNPLAETHEELRSKTGLVALGAENVAPGVIHGPVQLTKRGDRAAFLTPKVLDWRVHGGPEEPIG